MRDAGFAKYFLLILIVLLGAMFPAIAQFGTEPHLEARLISERSQIVPGDRFQIAVEATPDEGWHFYWQNPGDAGQPPFIEWRRTDGLTVSDFQWPLPERLPVIPGEIMDYGYSDREILFMTVTAPEVLPSTVRLEGDLKYLICEEVCIPEELEVSLSIAVRESPDQSIYAETLALAATDLPVPFAGTANFEASDAAIELYLQDPSLESAISIDFFPVNNEIVHAADINIVRNGDQAVLTFKPDPFNKTGATFEGLVVATDTSGSRTGYSISAIPGAVPVVAGVGSIAGQTAAGGSSAPPFFAILGLAFLGGMILNLMPCVLPILSLKAFGIVHSAASGNQAELRLHGIWYTAGVVGTFVVIAAAFIALRGAGEFVSVGFQLQYPIAVFLTSLVMFLIGLWLLGMFEFGSSIQSVGSGLVEKKGSLGAFFTGALAAFVGAPCIGPFLAVALGAVANQPAPNVVVTFAVLGFGMALPFLALSFVPGLQKLLPKPGPWMETLKQFFAFPVFLTALWLVSVLGDQTGTAGAVAALIVMVAIAFAIWLIKQGGAAPLRIGLAALVLVGSTVFAAPSLTRQSNAGDATAKYAKTLAAEAWTPERVTELVAEGRPIFVDFTASWCVTCQINKRTTLQNARVVEAFEKANVAFLVADYTNKDDVIGAELKKYESPGVPMYLYYAPGKSDPEVLSVVLSPAYVLKQIENN